MKSAAVVGTLVLASAALAQEPPPPPVEPVVAPEARAIDSRADELVRRMSALLKETPSFALEAEEVFDELPDDLPRAQLTGTRRVALKRPDRVAEDAEGDSINLSFWYDGKTLTSLDKAHNTYVSVPIAGSIDTALDTVLERSGTVIPLSDLLYSDVHARLMGSVERGAYLGLHQVAGVLCHHLSFEQPTLDWQLWIAAGEEPLPRKLVIVYKGEEGAPQYAVTILKWNLKAAVPDDLFRFEPPAGAMQVELPAFPVAADAAKAVPGSTPPRKEDRP